MTPIQPPDEPPANSLSQPQKKRLDLSLLTPSASNQGPENTLSPDNTPDSLLLLGTITGSPRTARAIIAQTQSADQTPGQYKIGETIAGYQLEKIDRQQVTMIRDGQSFLLKIKPPEESGQSDNLPTRTVIVTPEMTLKSTGGSSGTYGHDYPPLPDEPARPQVLPFEPASTTHIQASQETGVQLISQLLNDGEFLPWLDSQNQGLVYNGATIETGQKELAIQKNDIIRAINGQIITSPQKAYQVFQKARTLDQIDMEVIRGDGLIQVSFNRRN